MGDLCAAVNCGLPVAKIPVELVDGWVFTYCGKKCRVSETKSGEAEPGLPCGVGDGLYEVRKSQRARVPREVEILKRADV